MKIPLGEFGNSVAQAAPQPDSSGVFDTIRTAALQLQDTHNHLKKKRQGEREQLQREKAGNAVLDYRLEVEATTQETAAQVESGELDYDRAPEELQKRVATIKRPQIDLDDPVDVENFEHGLKFETARAGKSLVPVIINARKRDGVAQLDKSFDTLGKLAGLPGANLDELHAQAEAFTSGARTRGLPPDLLDRKLQDFKDRNWTNHATQRLIESSNNMGALKALGQDLTKRDGLYAQKLDTDKRNALLGAVQSREDRLIARAEAESHRGAARADRAIAEFDRQIASGVPATAELLSGWQSKVKGTDLEGEFKERLADEQLVQQVLRQPIGDQIKLVQDREAKLLTGGGSVREQMNVNRLKAAVQKNVQLLQTAPLLFNANRSGENPDPIDFSQVGDEAGDDAIAEKLAQRSLALDGMRRQYGAAVPMRPLLPQEAQELAQALDAATPKNAASMFAALRGAVGDDKTFRGMMAQIAPDSPVRALAGVLATKQRAVTLERNIVADDVTASAQDVAATILEGESILNSTKASKAGDGKPDKGLFMPGDSELQAKFKDAVGGAFALRPGDADVAWQAVRAYYAGKAAQTGRIAESSQDVDTAIVREAVKGTIGALVDYNGRGEVFAPWGMGDDQFEDAVEAALAAEATRRNVFAPSGPEHGGGRMLANAVEKGQLMSLEDQFGEIGLRQQSGNTYIVTAGRGVVPGPDGKPLVITVGE